MLLSRLPGTFLKRLLTSSGMSAVVALSGCGEPPESQVPPEFDGMIVHPVADSLFSDRCVNCRLLPQVDLALSDAKLLTVGTDGLVARFGNSDGDSILGGVTGGRFLKDGSVAILDVPFGLIKVFDSKLNLTRTLGGFGSGPGEFVRPARLFLNEDGGIGVSDLGLSRVTEWDFPLDGDPRQYTLPPGLTAACARDGGWIVMGPDFRVIEGRRFPSLHSPALIHHATFEDSDGISPLLQPYQFDFFLLASHLSEGWAECPRETQDYWAVLPWLHEVYSFQHNGVIKWVVRFVDSRVLQLVQTRHGAVGPHPRQVETGAFMLGNVVEGPDSTVVVHMHWVEGEASGMGTQPDYLFVLDRETGTLLSTWESEWQVLDAMGGMALFYRNAPHPELSISQFPYGFSTRREEL